MAELSEQVLNAQQALREQLAYHAGRGETSLGDYVNAVANVQAGQNATFVDERYVFDNYANMSESMLSRFPLDKIGGSLPPIQGEDLESWIRVTFEDVEGQGQFLIDYLDPQNPTMPETEQERVAVAFYDRMVGALFTPSDNETDLGTRHFIEAVKDYTLTDAEFSTIMSDADILEKGVVLSNNWIGRPDVTGYNEGMGDIGYRMALLTGGVLQGMIDVNGLGRNDFPLRHTQEETQEVMSNIGQYSTLLDAYDNSAILQITGARDEETGIFEPHLARLKSSPADFLRDETFGENVFKDLLDTVEAMCGTPSSVPNLKGYNGEITR